MGQAKNRKAEIDQLKASGPKMFKEVVGPLRSFGVYYKADEDHGFSIQFDRNLMDVEGLERVLQESILRYDEGIGDPTWAMSKDELAVWLHSQTSELCDTINIGLYGTDVQPHYGIHKGVNIKPELNNIVIFAKNVMWLTKNGYLQNDNFNGTNYCFGG